jgi:hypothetical protein
MNHLARDEEERASDDVEAQTYDVLETISRPSVRTRGCPSGDNRTWRFLMTVARDMLQATPTKVGYEADALAACIDACFDCAQACTACADACLGEDMVADLRRCITLDLNCADICAATGAVLSRLTGDDPGLTEAALTACRDACRRCGEECESHAGMHEHCRICAEACRRCEQACDRLLAA